MTKTMQETAAVQATETPEAFLAIREAMDNQRKGWRPVYLTAAAHLVDGDKATRGKHTVRSFADWAGVSHETVRGWLLVAPLVQALESRGIGALPTEASGLHGRVNTAKARGVSFDALKALTTPVARTLAKVATGDDAAAAAVLKAWTEDVKAAKDAAVAAKASDETSGGADENAAPEAVVLTPEEAYKKAAVAALLAVEAMVDACKAGATPGTELATLAQGFRFLADVHNAHVIAAREAAEKEAVPTPATVKRTRKAPAA